MVKKSMKTLVFAFLATLSLAACGSHPHESSESGDAEHVGVATEELTSGCGYSQGGACGTRWSCAMTGTGYLSMSACNSYCAQNNVPYYSYGFYPQLSGGLGWSFCICC